MFRVITTLLNPVSVFHIDQDLAAFQAGTGGPTGFSSRGRRTPRRVLGAGGRLEVVAAASVLVRHIALARKGTSLRLRTCFCPHNPPRVVQRQRKARRITGRAKFLREDAFRGGIGLLGIRSGWGWELWPPVRQRGMDYLRARLVTPYYYKKVIATGVMNHDRFFGIDAPYRDAQQGR